MMLAESLPKVNLLPKSNAEKFVSRDHIASYSLKVCPLSAGNVSMHKVVMACICLLYRVVSARPANVRKQQFNDRVNMLLQVLYSAAPIIHLVPCQQSELRQFPHYECPLYCTPERRGVLATTGHSTNFVMDLMIPSDRPQDHWCRRGVAFLLSLAGWRTSTRVYYVTFSFDVRSSAATAS